MFYETIRVVFRGLALPYFRFRVRGAGHVPASGAGVVVALHRSWLDPAAIGGAFPRPVRFLIRNRVYEKWWARWFYRRMGSIPVPSGGHEVAMGLRAALRLLQAGELVGVFPEGGVRPEGEPDVVFPGAAMLSVRVGAPIIPVAIRGSSEAWPRGAKLPRPAAVEVEVGVPIDPPRERTDAAVEAMLRRIEQALREMSGSGEMRGDASREETAWTRR
jgi:1-acyl-sn-glycerol-3-phosphate acyltransferase